MTISGTASQPARRLRPVVDMRLIIAHSQLAGQGFSARLEQRGARAIHGVIRSPDAPLVQLLQKLREQYERQLQMMRELALAGMPVPPPDEKPMLELGRRVAALLPPDICQAIAEAAQLARQRRGRLRLVLEVAHEARSLLSVPWEMIALPLGWAAQAGDAGDCFLLLNADVSLSRQVQRVGVSQPLALQHPLRLQAFAAAPLAAQAIDIDAAAEAVERARPAGGLERHWYSGSATLSEMLDRLRASQPQIVHLVCHGEQSYTGQPVPRYDLLLTHADGYTQRVGGGDLASILSLAPELRLVILQACYGGATAVGGGYAAGGQQIAESIALTLVRSGVPAVIAMQSEIGQHSAAAFARACYACLASGADLEQAVAGGRLAMRAAGGIVDWSLPVVYQGNRRPEESWQSTLTSQLRKIAAAGWRAAF